MFDELSPDEIALLRELAERGAPVSEARLDAAALRSLTLRRYVKRLSGFSIITPEGRRALESVERGEKPAAAPRGGEYFGMNGTAPEAPEPEPDATRVNATQEDMLRQLALADAPVPFDDLDGRVVRALEGRGLVRKASGMVEMTEAGRAFYRSKVQRRRRARSGWIREPRPAEQKEDRASPAASIREAVDVLRRAVGGAETVDVGDLTAPAEEAFAALLELADRIERGADPRRITRR